MPEFGVLRPPATVLFGEGSSSSIGELTSRLGRKALVCTDPFLARSPHATRVLASLRASGLEVEVLDTAVVEVPLESAEAAIEAARRIGPDVIVGLGGGSCIDLAKLIALGVSSGRPLREFYGEGAVAAATLPVVAVPTTAGTGSEVTPVAVLTDASQRLKVGISSPWLVPRAAVCDPLLTHGAPSQVTAFAGIDALAHAIEAYTAGVRDRWEDVATRVFVGRNVLSDRFALHAVELIARSLPAALDDDPTARAAMLEGSLCAGLAFATAGTGLAHALQYPIGAATSTPHGLGVGLLLPYVMAFNAPACALRLAEVSVAMGGASGAADAIMAVARLAAEVGVPGSLAEIGIGAGQLAEIAEQTLGIRRLVDNNPRAADAASIEALLEVVLAGDIERLAAGVREAT